jgi:flagellar motor switch protein FliN/FliY
VIGIELSPLEQSVFWVIPHEAVSDVTSACLTSDQQKEKFFDPRLQEGYYQFIMLEVLEMVNGLNIFKDLLPKMTFSPTLPQEECLCIDVAISFYPKTIYGRMVIPHSFLNLFKTHQPFEKPPLSKRQAVQHLEFTLRLETGSISLDQEEWKNISPGDYMILDKCSYDPEEKKGSILMYLEGTPILQARIKPDGIKILDYIFYSEDSENPLPSQEEVSDQSPFKIDIEAEHIRMPLENILALKPEHLLDVIVKPELGVNIILKNEQVGKGELMKLGDTIGVRISHIHG